MLSKSIFDTDSDQAAGYNSEELWRVSGVFSLAGRNSSYQSTDYGHVVPADTPNASTTPASNEQPERYEKEGDSGRTPECTEQTNAWGTNLK